MTPLKISRTVYISLFVTFISAIVFWKFPDTMSYFEFLVRDWLTFLVFFITSLLLAIIINSEIRRVEGEHKGCLRSTRRVMKCNYIALSVYVITFSILSNFYYVDFMMGFQNFILAFVIFHFCDMSFLIHDFLKNLLILIRQKEIPN